MPCAARALVIAGVLLLGCDPSPGETTARDAGAAAVAPTPVPPTPDAPRAAPKAAGGSAETWNAAQIDWQPFDAAMTRAKTEHKPALLVIYTTWCPHCRNYSHVFDDPRVVERARSFEMIRIDADAEPAIAAKYARDGSYIPRTYFLGADGSVDTGVHAANARYQFFYDERDPGSVLGAMSTALADLGAGK